VLKAKGCSPLFPVVFINQIKASFGQGSFFSSAELLREQKKKYFFSPPYYFLLFKWSHELLPSKILIA
jgi:hypothetical protein